MWQSIWGRVIIGGLLAFGILIVGARVIYHPYNMPSGSMSSTLLVGDYIFVSRIAYGNARNVLPLNLIPLSNHFIGGDPRRGDVVVFKLPTDNRTDYVKRVIGLPGDRIQVRGSLLYINDVAVERAPVEPFNFVLYNGAVRSVPQYRETLPNGVSYLILDESPFGRMDNTQVYTLPPGHYFMMGDNRDNSSDSRIPGIAGGVGFVPYENIVGRASIIYFSTDGSSIRWERIFEGIQGAPPAIL